MTKDEALKMALEALVTAEAGLADIGDADREPTDDLAWCEERAAQALAKPRQAITALREVLAQPAQEPVGWRNAAIRVGEDLCSVGPFGYYDMTAEQWLDWALSVVTVHASPPQRQPLTDAEIWQMVNDCSFNRDLHADKFARAIEAAHGIGDKK